MKLLNFALSCLGLICGIKNNRVLEPRNEGGISWRADGCRGTEHGGPHGPPGGGTDAWKGGLPCILPNQSQASHGAHGGSSEGSQSLNTKAKSITHSWVVRGVTTSPLGYFSKKLILIQFFSSQQAGVELLTLNFWPNSVKRVTLISSPVCIIKNAQKILTLFKMTEYVTQSMQPLSKYSKVYVCITPNF